VDALHKAGHDDLGSQNKNEQAIRVSPDSLLVEDLTAIGYPRPAPLLAASDDVFFGNRTAGPAIRSALIYLFSSSHIKLYPAFRHAPLGADPESGSSLHLDSGFARARARAPRNDGHFVCSMRNQLP
jgi:hypothetical protein